MNEQEQIIDKTQTNLKLNAAEIVTQLNQYQAQADKSLNQLQTNIDAGTKQLEEWKKMQLILVGQRQVVLDLLGKVVEPPAPTTNATV